MNDSSWTLKTKYTYTLGKLPADKVLARSRLGEMSADIIDDVAMDALKKGVGLYLQYLGWEQPTIQGIINGPVQMGTQQNGINGNSGGLEPIKSENSTPQTETGDVIADVDA